MRNPSIRTGLNLSLCGGYAFMVASLAVVVLVNRSGALGNGGYVCCENRFSVCYSPELL